MRVVKGFREQEMVNRGYNKGISNDWVLPFEIGARDDFVSELHEHWGLLQGKQGEKKEARLTSCEESPEFRRRERLGKVRENGS